MKPAGDVFSVLLDLAHVPALCRGYEGDADKKSKGDDLPDTLWYEEVVVAGFENVHAAKSDSNLRQFSACLRSQRSAHSVGPRALGAQDDPAV